MFHLEYNRVRGYFDWSELRCLCRSLGFQPDLIVMNLPREVDQKEDGMTIKDILRIINLKYLDLAVDKSFNAHTADWNLCVFKKAFVLLDHRILTYQELHDIRVAFSAYEHQDLKGMEIDENTIIRCLKMCGRIIAPLKMHHRIKHMSQMFDEEGRIQLYEFLDLILWTELYNTHRPHEPVVTNAKKKNAYIYQVENFHHIIQHYDERLAQYLNELYLHEEWSFGKEEFSKQKLPNELPVNREFRLNNMRRSNKHYSNLKGHVGSSQKIVHLTSTGHIRPRPLTAPNLEKYDQSEKSSIYTTHSQHKLSIADMLRDYMHTPANRYVKSVSARAKVPDQSVANKSVQLSYKPVSPAVTSEEKREREHDLQSLKFHISTLDNRYDQKLQHEMQETLPNYVPRVKVEEDESDKEPPKPVPKAINPALLPDHIDRLAYAPYRPTPKHSHAHNCDARFRGWHTVKTSKGPHYVLTTAAFSNSPTAKLQAQLHKDSCQVVKSVKGDCVIRRTTSDNVKTEPTRSSMAPSTPQVSSTEPHSKGGQLVHTSKTERSSGQVQLNSLVTIKEGNKSRKTSAERSAEHSIERSAGTSSNRTFNVNDFKLYTEEYEKPAEKVEAEASNLTDKMPTHPSILVHGPSTENIYQRTANRPINNRRYSQVTGDAIAQEIVGQVDGDLGSKTYSEKYIAMKIHKMKNFVERRSLSGFARKRLIDSARGSNRVVSAC